MNFVCRVSNRKTGNHFSGNTLAGPEGRLYALSAGEGLILKRIKNKSVFGRKAKKEQARSKLWSGLDR